MKKSITMILPEIGEVEVFLNEEQFDSAIEKGKKEYEKRIEDGISFFERLQRIREKSNKTLENDDGFTNNKEDWKTYFPDISFETIFETVEEARKQEEDIRKKARIACSLIEIAFATYLGSSSIASVDRLKKITSTG